MGCVHRLSGWSRGALCGDWWIVVSRRECVQLMDAIGRMYSSQSSGRRASIEESGVPREGYGPRLAGEAVCSQPPSYLVLLFSGVHPSVVVLGSSSLPAQNLVLRKSTTVTTLLIVTLHGLDLPSSRLACSRTISSGVHRRRSDKPQVIPNPTHLTALCLCLPTTTPFHESPRVKPRRPPPRPRSQNGECSALCVIPFFPRIS